MICLLDMDGVLVDFHKGWLKHKGLHGDVTDHFDRGDYSMVGKSDYEFWNGVGDQFWEELDWMEDGREILSIVKEHFSEICLVTQSPHSLSYIHVGLSGKVNWIARHIPELLGNFMIGTGRRFYASPSTLLIDDFDKNITDFDQRGGNTILLPRYWNSNHSLSNDTVGYLRKVIRKYD